MTHVSLTSILTLRLTVATAERLKSLGLFDVMALPVELQQLYELRTDPRRFLKVVFEMLELNAATAEMTFDSFAAQVTDETTYSQFWEAFTREVTDFSRAAIRPAIAALFQMLETAETERVADLTATIQHSLSQTAASLAGDLSGEPLELPESIPDLSRCDSLTIWPPAADATNGAATPACALSPPTATGDATNPLSAPTTSTPIEILRAG